MKTLKIEIISVVVSMILSLIYIFQPDPFTMFVFVFIAQPLVIYAIVSAGLQIYKELKDKNIL